MKKSKGKQTDKDSYYYEHSVFCLLCNTCSGSLKPTLFHSFLFGFFYTKRKKKEMAIRLLDHLLQSLYGFQ